MNYKLYNGDCLEIMDKLIKDNIKVDCILTDPPYGTTVCKWDDVIPFDEMWKRLNKLTKDNSPIILFGKEPFSSYLRISNIKNYKYDWKWNKVNGGNPLVAKFRPMSIFEDVLVFGKKKVNYYPIMEKAKEENKRSGEDKINKKTSDLLSGFKSGFRVSEQRNEDLRYPKNELKYNNKSGELNSSKRLHSAQKPVRLLEYLIKTYTNEGEVVLDFTMGSGSTGVACVNTNRQFIGIELDKNYFEIAEKRIKEADKNA